MDEYVVLVNDNNEAIGQALKSTVHTDDTPLHRAFSVFLFNNQGELLLQQRSKKKKTWPLIWSNSCCGHPAPGEDTIDAIKRRLQEELGLEVNDIQEIIPDYKYRAEMYGIVEHEICPVFVAISDKEPILNPNEVEAIKWINWHDFQTEVISASPPYSAWCIEETKLLNESPKFQDWYNKLITK